VSKSSLFFAEPTGLLNRDTGRRPPDDVVIPTFMIGITFGR
jgi:hypothetical protein